MNPQNRVWAPSAMAACGPSTGLSQAREAHEHVSREETGHGSDPTWLTEARIGIVIHLYPAISWYQAGERTVPLFPLGQYYIPIIF